VTGYTLTVLTITFAGAVTIGAMAGTFATQLGHDTWAVPTALATAAATIIAAAVLTGNHP